MYPFAFLLFLLTSRRIEVLSSTHRKAVSICRNDMEVTLLPPMSDHFPTMLHALFKYLTEPNRRACGRLLRFGGMSVSPWERVRESVSVSARVDEIEWDVETECPCVGRWRVVDGMTGTRMSVSGLIWAAWRHSEFHWSIFKCLSSDVLDSSIHVTFTVVISIKFMTCWNRKNFDLRDHTILC